MQPQDGCFLFAEPPVTSEQWLGGWPGALTARCSAGSGLPEPGPQGSEPRRDVHPGCSLPAGLTL